MLDTETRQKMMTELQLQIINEIKRDGRVMDTRLAQFFEQHPWTFHEEVKKSECAKKYTFYGLLEGNRGAITWKYGETEYENPMLGGIRPFTEAFILTKEDIINDLKEIFPQHRNQIAELIEQL